MFVSPPNSYIEILTPECEDMKRQVFGWCFSHESGALMNGISALIKEAAKGPSPPFYHVKM